MPGRRELATAYLGLVPLGLDPAVPADTGWHPVDRLPPLAFDHGEIVLAGRERLRGKLSYTNVGYALAPESFTLPELRAVYAAALGHDVSATNLKRVLLRRRLLEPTGERREPGPAGGRPAELFRFRTRELEITDGFAVLEAPARVEPGGLGDQRPAERSRPRLRPYRLPADTRRIRGKRLGGVPMPGWLKIVAALSLVAEASAAAALLLPARR